MHMLSQNDADKRLSSNYSKLKLVYNSRTQMILPIVCKIPRNLSQFFRAVFGNILVALHLLHSTQ